MAFGIIDWDSAYDVMSSTSEGSKVLFLNIMYESFAFVPHQSEVGSIKEPGDLRQILNKFRSCGGQYPRPLEELDTIHTG